jgi:lysozyme
MKISNEGLQLIRKYEGSEGYKSTPYRCAAGKITVGYGHVIGNGLQLPDEWNRTLSLGEINELLRTDLARFERGVLRYCPVYLTQCQFDALVSFSFNLGLGVLQRSTLRQKINRGDADAAKVILKYNMAGGRILKGLIRRRQAEYRLFTAPTDRIPSPAPQHAT